MFARRLAPHPRGPSVAHEQGMTPTILSTRTRGLLSAGCLCAALSACASAGELAVSDLALEEGPLGELTELDRRGERVLLSGAPSTPGPQTDERPTVRLVLRGPAGDLEVPGRMLGGALTAQGAVFVTEHLELVDEQGRLLDEEVIPELSVRADGRAVAYPHRAGSEAGVYVADLDDGAVSLVTRGLAVADRPRYLADGRLVVIGARASGIAGVWLLDPERAGQPVPITNAELRTGRPLGPSFVPPPAYHASMRVEAGALVYDDGRREQRVALPGGAS